MKGNKVMSTAKQSKAELELLLKIATIHLNQFYLAMKDRWSSDDYQRDSEYTRQLRQAEIEYVTTYGKELPDWQYHEDVRQAHDRYKIELNQLEQLADQQDDVGVLNSNVLEKENV